MFYDTEEGIEELCSYHENEIQDQNRSKKYSNNEGDELDLSEQETNDKPTKTHRNEVSMLKDDTNVLLLSSTRPRRVTGPDLKTILNQLLTKREFDFQLINKLLTIEVYS